MKFIHTGDIHLGAKPDGGYDWGEVRGQEIWDSFRKLIEVVSKEQVDLLLIAGDLFHRQPLRREVKEVNHLFSTIPETQVVVMAGNHDYLGRDSYYLDFPWNENVTGLWEEELKAVYLDKIATWVYGFSYDSREIVKCKYRGVKRNEQGGIHILLGHGGDEKHVPMGKEELHEGGFDYVALGHIHRPEILVRDRAAYCGALEPLDRNDVGPHGYIKGEYSEEGIRVEFVPFACRSYVALVMQVDGDTTQFSLERDIEEKIRQAGEQNIFSIRLVGWRDPDVVFSAEGLMRLGNVVGVTDDSRPDYDVERLFKVYKGSLIGRYIEEFAGDDSPEGKKALSYGLHALLEGKR